MSFFLISAYSQEVDSTITIIKKKQYYQNDQKLTNVELQTILTNNPASASEYKKSTRKSYIGLGLGLVGTSIVAVAAFIDLSSSIKQSNDLNNGNYSGDYKDVGLGVYLGGLACVVVALPIVLSGRKNLHKSVGQYNSSFNKVGIRPVKLDLVVNSNGLGIRMRF